MGRICSTHGRDEKCIPEGMRPLGGRRWKDNIKMELEVIGCGLVSTGSV